jgi:hypothetical protein
VTEVRCAHSVGRAAAGLRYSRPLEWAVSVVECELVRPVVTKP